MERYKLHLDLSELARERLKELQVVYPFASQRAIAKHVLEQALLQPLVPSGIAKPLLPSEADGDD